MESSNSLWSAQHHQSHHKLHLLSMFSTVSPSTAAKLWIGLVRFIFVPFWTTALKQFWTVSQMPLESHSAEAKCLITAFLESVLHQLPHWYSPMLPEDHPSSICHLLGLRSVECNLVLKSFGTLKMRGQTDKQHLRKMPSNHTYRNTPCLLPLKQIQVLINHWLPRKTQSYWIPGDATHVPFFSDQINNSLLSLPVTETNVHQIALKALAKRLVWETTAESDGTREGNGVIQQQ